MRGPPSQQLVGVTEPISMLADQEYFGKIFMSSSRPDLARSFILRPSYLHDVMMLGHDFTLQSHKISSQLFKQNWFFGYSSYLNFQFTVIDVPSTDYWAIGGTTNKDHTSFCEHCSRSGAVFIMLMEGIVSDKPSLVYMVSTVTIADTEYTVSDITSLRVAEQDAQVFGIFQTTGTALLVFQIKESVLKMWTSPAFATAGCSIGSHSCHIHKLYSTQMALAWQDCTSKKTYIATWINAAQMYVSEYDQGDNGEELLPMAIDLRKQSEESVYFAGMMKDSESIVLSRRAAQSTTIQDVTTVDQSTAFFTGLGGTFEPFKVIEVNTDFAVFANKKGTRGPILIIHREDRGTYSGAYTYNSALSCADCQLELTDIQCRESYYECHVTARNLVNGETYLWFRLNPMYHTWKSFKHMSVIPTSYVSQSFDWHSSILGFYRGLDCRIFIGLDSQGTSFGIVANNLDQTEGTDKCVYSSTPTYDEILVEIEPETLPKEYGSGNQFNPEEHAPNWSSVSYSLSAETPVYYSESAEEEVDITKTEKFSEWENQTNHQIRNPCKIGAETTFPQSGGVLEVIQGATIHVEPDSETANQCPDGSTYVPPDADKITQIVVVEAVNNGDSSSSSSFGRSDRHSNHLKISSSVEAGEYTVTYYSGLSTASYYELSDSEPEQTITIRVIEQSCNPPTFPEPSGIVSPIRHALDTSTEISFEADADTIPDCFYPISYVTTCETCGLTEEGDLRNLLGLVPSDDYFILDKNLDPTYTWNMIWIQASDENAIGIWNINYQRKDSSDAVALTYTFQVEVRNSLCVEDPLVANPPNQQVEVNGLLFIELTKDYVDNGQCEYSLADMTSQASLDLLTQGEYSADQDLEPIFDLDPNQPGVVLGIDPFASLTVDFTGVSPSTVTLGKIPIVIEVTYAHDNSNDEISFEVDLVYCSPSFPSTPPQPEQVVQMTGSPETLVSNTIYKQNFNTDCSDTILEVFDKNTGQAPSPDIFQIDENPADGSLTVTILGDLPVEATGDISLQIIERLKVEADMQANAVVPGGGGGGRRNLQDDEFITEIEVHILQPCDLCSISPSQVSQVSELDLETFTATFAWDQFVLGTIELHGITGDLDVCKTDCPPIVTGVTMSTSEAQAQATTVDIDDNSRQGTLTLPQDMTFTETVTIDFQLAITEHIYEPEYASAELAHTLSFEIVYVAPEVPEVEEVLEVEEVILPEIVIQIEEEPEEEVAEPEPEIVEDIEEEVVEEEVVEEEEDDEFEEVPEGVDASKLINVNLFVWKPPKPRKRPQQPNQPAFVIEIPPLVVSNSYINETGTLFVEFSKPIFIPDKYANLAAKLSNPNFNPQIDQVIALEVISSFYDEEADEIAIEEYKLRTFNQTGFTIDVQFKNTAFITQSLTEQDVLQVTFLHPELFVDKIDFEVLANKTQLNVVCPPQMTTEEFAALVELNEQVEGPMTLFTTIQFASNIFLAYGLKYLWNMVNLLQFVIFFQRWRINIDSSASVIITQIRKLALFEFVDTQPATEKVKEILGMEDEKEVVEEFCNPEVEDCPEEEPKRRRRLQDDDSPEGEGTEEEGEDGEEDESESFERLGSANIIDNLGMMLILGIVLVFAVTLIIVLAWFLRKNQKFMELFTKIKKKLFWNTFIRSIVQSTLKVQLDAAAVIVLVYHGEDTDPTGKAAGKVEAGEGKSKFMLTLPSLIILVVFNLMPILFYCVMTSRKLRDRLHEADVKEKYGTMYATVDPKYDGSLYYNICFLVRRSLYVVITFMLYGQPGIQIQAFIYLTMLYLIYLHYWPKFNESLTLKVETMNEVIFILMCYHMVLFSNLVWLPTTKHNLGKSLVFCIFFLLGVNTMIIVYVSLKTVLRNRRLKYLKAQREEKFTLRQYSKQVTWAAQNFNVNFNKLQNPELYKQIDQELVTQVKIIDNYFRRGLTNLLVDDQAKYEKSCFAKIQKFCSRKKKLSKKDELIEALKRIQADPSSPNLFDFQTKATLSSSEKSKARPNGYLGLRSRLSGDTSGSVELNLFPDEIGSSSPKAGPFKPSKTRMNSPTTLSNAKQRKTFKRSQITQNRPGTLLQPSRRTSLMTIEEVEGEDFPAKSPEQLNEVDKILNDWDHIDGKKGDDESELSKPSVDQTPKTQRGSESKNLTIDIYSGIKALRMAPQLGDKKTLSEVESQMISSSQTQLFDPESKEVPQTMKQQEEENLLVTESDCESKMNEEDKEIEVSDKARIATMRLLKAVVDMRMPTEQKIGGLFSKKRRILDTYSIYVTKQLQHLEEQEKLNERKNV